MDYAVNGLGTMAWQKNLHVYFPLLLSLERSVAEKIAMRLLSRDLLHSMEVGYIIESELSNYSRKHGSITQSNLADPGLSEASFDYLKQL